LHKKAVRDTIPEKIKRALGWADADVQAYSLLVQKQAGSSPSDFDSNLKVSDKYDAIWRYPDDKTMPITGGWRMSDVLDRDRYYAILLEREPDSRQQRVSENNVN
jgi:hypothetical protein